MSDDIYDNGGVIVTRFAGPASEGSDRARWQLNVQGDEHAHVTLARNEVIELAHALMDSAQTASGRAS